MLLIFLLVITLPLIIFQVLQQQRTRQEAKATPKPNIIVIMTDDQQTDLMGKYMPNVRDRLQKRGMTFEKAYVTTSTCCPSRAGFLSGMYTHNTGVWFNKPPQGGFQTFVKIDKQTLPVWLNKAGYRTSFVGKYMNGYPDTRGKKYVPPGWDDWHAITKGRYFDFCMNENKKEKCYGKKAADYSTDVFNRIAIDFIKKANKTKKPFYLQIATNAPHGDGRVEDDHSPPVIAPRHRNKCPNVPKHRPPNFNESDMSDKPSWVKKKKKLTAQQINRIDRFRSAQACALKAVDEMVDDIVKTLRQTNQLDNTMIIFMGDNGYSMGEHRITSKACYYEGCSRVPLVISYPKVTKQSQKTQQLATNLDVTATILDAAGVAIPGRVNGKSLLPILSDPNKKIHEGILLEETVSGKTYAIRTDEYKYIEIGDGEKELYDLKNDPYELNNLIKDNSIQETVKKLAANLALLKQNKDIPPEISEEPTDTPEPTEDIEDTEDKENDLPSDLPDEEENEDAEEDEYIDDNEDQESVDNPTPTDTEESPTATPDGEEEVEDDESGKDTSEESIFISFNLLLNGIGSAGDTRNPQKTDLSNKDPLTVTRDIEIRVLDGDREVLSLPEEFIDYDPSTGTFVGMVQLPSSLAGNSYRFAISIPNYLPATSETLRIEEKKELTLPTMRFTAGDVNLDHTLSILDYNMMISCFGEGDLPDACFRNDSIVGDLNDDAYVREDDYNLFLRELAALNTR